MNSTTIDEAAGWLETHFSASRGAALVLVLGSGWNSVVDDLMEIREAAAYADIPGFPVSTVDGHSGRLLFGELAGVPLWVMQGRFHYYEGYGFSEVCFPVRVFARLGARGIFLTNAAGGIDPSYRPGGLMVIEDHINLMGDHPLRGPNLDEFGPRFPDMTEAWDGPLRDILLERGRELEIPLYRGVYAAMSGPSFETPAEVRALSILGAHAVGMSTVPECLVARHSGLRVAGLSCITNLAAHHGGEPLTHEEVARAAALSHKRVVRLLRGVIPQIQAQL
ncbi:MAG: purine-nucleoside phosphorylase [Oceanipulchritudo sp.]